VKRIIFGGITYERKKYRKDGKGDLSVERQMERWKRKRNQENVD